ncbi:MAG: acetyl-CoA carboxylase biotin carboxyl carrier protein [Acidobacteriota bacterium]|nr:acetyl-CoA carboxylase biotin carboxyl carrier protein [Acidobacteriota bacterium]
MTLDEIRELISLATETGVAELEVQRGDNRVRIALTSGRSLSSAPPPQPTTIQAPASPIAAAVPAKPDPSVVLVKSPIVGTFYESSSPSGPPFVRVGETVQPGKVLCIIESMKLMNEIEAEVAGVIESKLVPNGQPVEYGEALFAIRSV